MPKGVYPRKDGVYPRMSKTWEQRIALIAAKKKFIGIPLSEEHKKKISDTKRKKSNTLKEQPRYTGKDEVLFSV